MTFRNTTLMRPWLLAASLLLAPLVAHAASPTLEAARARGSLNCGVYGTLPGFSAPDTQGTMRGLHADYCRALAAAALGDAKKVTFTTYATPAAGLSALREGKVDILARNLTLTMTRDTTLGVSPVGVMYYDGLGFMAPSASGIASAQQLEGKRVCLAAQGTTTEQGVQGFAARASIALTTVPLADAAAVYAALKAGQCDAVAADMSSLAARRVTEFPEPASMTILPEIASKEPLGPYVRQGDGQWREIGLWVLQALIEAEELGVASGTLVQAMQSRDQAVLRLIGREGELGKAIGLAPDWAEEMIAQVGNYGEIFERNLGMGSVIGLNRGLNDLWLRGGLLYALPLR